MDDDINDGEVDDDINDDVDAGVIGDVDCEKVWKNDCIVSRW